MTNMYKDRNRIAINIALMFGQIDGDHHKAWVIDQMVRALTGCRYNQLTYSCIAESDEYRDTIASYCAGDEGEGQYEWDTGIAP